MFLWEMMTSVSRNAADQMTAAVKGIAAAREIAVKVRAET